MLIRAVLRGGGRTLHNDSLGHYYFGPLSLTLSQFLRTKSVSQFLIRHWPVGIVLARLIGHVLTPLRPIV